VQGHDQDKSDAAADTCWRVTTATGVQFACRVHLDGGGIEVRLTTTQEQLVCAKAVPSLHAAGEVVRGWLRAVVSDEGLSVLFAQDGTVH
jgi:hypothetical protein